MAHSVDIPYLDRKRIEKYLGDLAEEIEKADIEENFERLYGSKYYLYNDDIKMMYVNMQLSR